MKQYNNNIFPSTGIVNEKKQTEQKMDGVNGEGRDNSSNTSMEKSGKMIQ